MLGAALLAGGIIGDGIAFARWAAQGYGHFEFVRVAFFSSLSLFVGIEILFGSVFLSMLGISRDTYIGE
jgi:hypothetical protein